MSKKKVRKKAKIRNPYNQVPHLTQNTLWESDKSTRKLHIQKRLEVSPFPAGDHKAARHRQDRSKTNTIKKKDPQKKSGAYLRVRKNACNLQLLLLIFFKINFFKKNLSGIPSECQTDWIQIRPDILSDLIWIQSVCNGHQQRTLSRQ